MAQITINIDEDGTTEWTTSGLDGLDTLGKMAETIFDMNQHFLKDALHPVLRTPASRVCIEFDGADTVAVSYRPEGDPKTALGLMQAALCGLAGEAASPNFDPMQAVLGAILIPVEGNN